MCTNLSLTVSWYKYIQYKSPSNRRVGINMYISLSHRMPEKICTNLPLTVSWYPTHMYSTNLSLTGSWHKCVQISLSHRTPEKYIYNSHSLTVHVSCMVQACTAQISLSPEAGINMYESLSYRTPVNICTNLSFTGHQ